MLSMIVGLQVFVVGAGYLESYDWQALPRVCLDFLIKEAYLFQNLSAEKGAPKDYHNAKGNIMCNPLDKA